MDFESKYLDLDYLSARLQDFAEIRKGNITYNVKHSDNRKSLSVYIDLFMNGVRCHTMRISDHCLKVEQTQFIIKPDKVLTSKKKQQFKHYLESCIKQAVKKNYYNALFYR